MNKTKVFLIDYLNRKACVTSKRELARDVVSLGFNKYRLTELCNLSSEYEDLLVQFDKLRNYIYGYDMTILEIQMTLARFANELRCSDLEPGLIHELSDDSWAVISTLDYIRSMEMGD